VDDPEPEMGMAFLLEAGRASGGMVVVDDGEIPGDMVLETEIHVNGRFPGGRSLFQRAVIVLEALDLGCGKVEYKDVASVTRERAGQSRRTSAAATDPGTTKFGGEIEGMGPSPYRRLSLAFGLECKRD